MSDRQEKADAVVAAWIDGASLYCHPDMAARLREALRDSDPLLFANAGPLTECEYLDRGAVYAVDVAALTRHAIGNDRPTKDLHDTTSG